MDTCEQARAEVVHGGATEMHTQMQKGTLTAKFVRRTLAEAAEPGGANRPWPSGLLAVTSHS